MQPHVSAILLAAGSRRMGCCKQLLPVDGQPAIVRCLTCLFAAGIDEIVVVIGANGGDVGEAVSRFSVRTAYNMEPESDMIGSVRVGMREIPPAATGVLVALADHPLVSSATCRRLLRLHCSDPLSIHIPTYNGRKGHPTLFPRHLLDGISSLPNLRDVVLTNSRQVRLTPVPDRGVVLDMDTPEEYRMLKRLCKDGPEGGTREA